MHDLDGPQANRAIDEAFAQIARVHRLMSFQELESDVSRLNRKASENVQQVDPATFEVLKWAEEISAASQGTFDITVAPKLVAWGMLPRPDAPQEPDPKASWRDIELLEGCNVRFRRPLWIDLGGIAKGYAVDLAIETLKGWGARQAAVNAGGDLRIFGPERERVSLQPEQTATDGMPVLEIENAAIASSSGHVARRMESGMVRGPHVDGRNGTSIPTDLFASVLAESCLIADALTKPALILQEESESLLRRYRAFAHLHDPKHRWRQICPA